MIFFISFINYKWQKRIFQIFMTDNIYKYGECKRIKSSKKKKSKIFAITVFILAVLVTLVVADLISSRISGGKSIFFGGKIKVSSFNVYALEVSSFDTKTEAVNFAAGIKTQGGAGYIYENKKFYVFISMYENLLDAEQIKNNLKEQNILANIYQLSAPAINLNFSGSDDALYKSLKAYKELYKQVYDLSISFDGETISKAELKTQLSKIEAEIGEIIADLKADTSNSAEIILVRASLEKVKTGFKYLISSPESDLKFNSEIKNLYFDIIFEYLNIARSF